jgi:alpha-amylase
MGVMWHAAFKTGKAGKERGMPSPVDGNPNTPWPTRLWLKYMQPFSRFGGTVLAMPPVSKGQTLGTGYDPYNFNDLGSNKHGPAGRRETRYGSVEEIMACVAVCRALSMQVYTNVVHHHVDGDPGNLRYDYVAGDGVTPGRFRLDRNCFWVWSKDQPINPDRVFNPNFDWPFGREFLWLTGTYGDGKGDNGPGYVKRGLMDATDSMTRRLNFEGYFADDAKGSSVEYIGWLYRQGAMSGHFSFAELSEGTTAVIMNFLRDPHNNFRVGVLDFPIRYKIRDVCNWKHNFHVLLSEGVIWQAPESAVTFVENIDLDISDPIFARKRLAYALIMGLPGYPMVFGKDFYSREDGGYGMSIDVLGNLIWCHETFAKGDTWVRAIGGDYIVFERMGDGSTSGAIFAYTTRNDWLHVPNVPTKWRHQRLHDYHGQAIDKWTDDDGHLDLWIPPDGDNAAGNGHCCYAVADVENPIHLTPRPTTQVVIGSADRDITQAKNGKRVISKIYCAADTPIHATLAVEKVDWAAVTTIRYSVIGPDGAEACWAFVRHNTDPEAHGRITHTGWHTLVLDSTGLPEPVGADFTFKVTYTAPQTLSEEDF